MPGVHMHEGRIGVPLITLERTESTNKYAAELLSQGKVAHGAVIVAHEQTAGRGQRGRIWHSQAGADLAMSVVLGYKRLEAGAQF
ncbi:MAG TPA: hypothetical protein PL106_08255, partial [Flavobacteriales bacterium]|nr:hypothetical protein [Flavobacteriales bacterium]